jgi:GNAT superfamily N-acetyltransferase
VGVHPDYRRLGLGRRLYERFFVAAQMHGRRFVRSITAPSNQLSIAFHRGMGFEPLHGDVVVDGVPVWFDYAGAGGHRVVFRRPLALGVSSPARADTTGDDDLDEVLAS